MTQTQHLSWVEGVADQSQKAPPVIVQDASNRLDLYRHPWLRAMLASRWPQFAIRTVTFLGFIFTIITALSGTGVGSHNFAIIMVWIAWWTALKLGFIPLGGRTWCSVCPIPLAGDWLQQGGILVKGKHSFSLNLQWPKALRSSWLQSAGFLLVGLFSAVTLTEARLTGWILLATLALATVLSLIFEHRAFCSYLCPVGGFSGLYAKTAPLEVRVVNVDVCAAHSQKSCYQACPWGLYPLALKDSSTCGLCLECLRACPKDNLALNLRPYGSDLAGLNNRSDLDETFLALVMLGSVLIFSAVFIGPWGWLKAAAYAIGSLNWTGYSLGFLAFTLVILPAFFTFCVWAWKKLSGDKHPLRWLVTQFSQGLLPLGMLSWMAFTVSFALPKLNLVLAVINDPFGSGWHWLNLSYSSASLDVSGFSPYLQVILLVIGLLWSANVTQKSVKMGKKDNALYNLPILGFYLLYTGVILWLLVG